MYKNKLVTCIKVNEEIQKEEKNKVYLPKDTRHSIFIKNENNKKVILDLNYQDYYFTNLIIKPKQSLTLTKIPSGKKIKFKPYKSSSKVKIKFVFIEEDYDYVENHQKYEMILEIDSIKENQEVLSTMGTKTKKVCLICEKKFKNTYNYCPYDGNLLQNN